MIAPFVRTLPAAALLLLVCGAAPPDPPAARERRMAGAWAGAWTFDLCHEDRKPDHDPESYCREGKDRILISVTPGGRVDLKRCPADPWNDREPRLSDGAQALTFRTSEGYEIRLRLAEDRDHFLGRFASRDGHAGRIRGRRLPGC